jgi:hypothetical protein
MSLCDKRIVERLNSVRRHANARAMAALAMMFAEMQDQIVPGDLAVKW